MAIDAMKYVSMEEVDKPNPIYKYRKWDDKYQRTLITERKVFMANPTSFEDPKDCNNRIRYDLLTHSQLVEMYYNSSLEMNSGFNYQQHVQFANEWADKSPLKDPLYVKSQQEEEFQGWCERMGVLCITGEPKNIKMWEKYSDGHRGICIGFDSNLLFSYFGRGGIINYVDALPDVMPSIIDDYMTQNYKQVFYKEKSWEFENEYRITKFHPEPLTTEERVITLPPEVFKEIIFGAKLSQSHKDEIIEITKVSMPHVVFKQAKLVNGVIVIETFQQEII